VLPVSDVVGLTTRHETVERSEIDDGLEIDLVTHDVKKFFAMVLKKNGYVLEQLFSPLVLQTTSEHEELKAIARECVTRFHAYHYFGFAETQWKLFLKSERPRVKPLLYVYRVLLTGIHLMRSGEIEADLRRLNETAKLPYLNDLIKRKIVGPEKAELDQADLAFYETEYERLRGELQRAFETSGLPEAARGADALNDLLVRIRLKGIPGTG
jgi:predicted nucleotidyltransferase